ncbi:hypothetical protein [Antarctic virus CAA_003_44]|nr:hypothetical protein [Antarctic virus CAA_003_44]
MKKFVPDTFAELPNYKKVYEYCKLICTPDWTESQKISMISELMFYFEDMMMPLDDDINSESNYERAQDIADEYTSDDSEQEEPPTPAPNFGRKQPIPYKKRKMF